MDWKKLFYKIVFPPALVVWLFTLIATVGMIIVSINGFAMNPLFYLIYALSFYAVCILAVYLVKKFYLFY